MLAVRSPLDIRSPGKRKTHAASSSHLKAQRRDDDFRSRPTSWGFFQKPPDVVELVSKAGPHHGAFFKNSPISWRSFQNQPCGVMLFPKTVNHCGAVFKHGLTSWCFFQIRPRIVAYGSKKVPPRGAFFENGSALWSLTNRPGRAVANKLRLTSRKAQAKVAGPMKSSK